MKDRLFESRDAANWRRSRTLLCDILFLIAFGVVVPSIVFCLSFLWGELCRYTSDSSWTPLTAKVISVEEHAIRGGWRLQVFGEAKDGHLFQDVTNTISSSREATEARRALEAKGTTTIFKSKSKPVEYVISYVVAGHQKYDALLLGGGISSSIIVVCMLSAWFYWRRRVEAVSTMRPRILN